MFKFNETLFSELRVVPVDMKLDVVLDDNMVRAITDNENIITLGYTLKPEDIVKLSKCDICLYDIIKSYVDKVDADPMYPDFPSQVMTLDEATFRFHQMMHYFSTYGVRYFFNVEVSKGWLPDVEKTEKIEKQNTNLPSKTISLIDEHQKYMFVLNKLLSKRERLTIPEKELVAYSARNVKPSMISRVQVAFKENLLDLFVLLFDAKYYDDAIFSICQHTGDVLTCIRYLLTKHHYKLSTSERKRCVRLLERYSSADFKTNLILSNKKAKNSFIVLDYLSYNKFSRSIEHKKAVSDLRNGELHGWESDLKKMIREDKNVLPYVSKRPGMLLRMVAWLLRLGYTEENIISALTENDNAKTLSMQTLISILNTFTSSSFSSKEEAGVIRVMINVLFKRMKYLNTPLKYKKIFIDEGIYDFDHSRIETNNKSEEGGYIRSGLTFKIPDYIDILRFFVYWNDQRCVDIDLHSSAYRSDKSRIHIGWNGDYHKDGICFSGDITHSDAAEFIDINLNNTTVEFCKNNIHIYSGASSFKNIDTCFTGMMALRKEDVAKKIKLYDPKNCFFYHNLRGSNNYLQYCLIEPKNRLMQIIAKNERDPSVEVTTIESGFSLSQYLDLLLASQNSVLVNNRDEAELVIQLDKGSDICLIDENYFMDS